MPILNPNCGCVVVLSNTWEPETTAYIKALQDHIGECKAVGNAFDVVVKLAKAGGGSAITIDTTAGSTTATDSRLADKSIIFLSGSGFTVPYNPPLAADSNGTFSFSDGFPGGPVSIFYQ